jgi:hypothetical protein
MMQTYAAGRTDYSRWGIGAELPPNSVIIECAKLTLRNRAVDIDVDIYPHQLDNIDTIVVNGYTYKKEET